MAFKDYTGLIGDTIGGGLKYFGSQEERKSAEAQADALKSKGYSDIEVAKLMLEGKKVRYKKIKSSLKEYKTPSKIRKDHKGKTTRIH